MITDEQLHDDFTALLQGVEAPEISLERIHRRVRAPMHHDRRPFAIGAAAAAALAAAVALPIASPGVVQTLEQKIAAILHWTPPTVKPPASLYKAMQPQTVSLDEAQKRVNFTIVPPKGVPSDATGPSITIAPIGVYSETTHTWSTGPYVVFFAYKRAGGQSFLVSAASTSNQSGWVGPPSKYTFEDRGVDKAGNPILVRHERFVWRNGDQNMTMIADVGITAAEILAIQNAMHGTLIPGVWPPKHGGADMVRIPKPR
jgi:hypothetical protein